MVNDTIAINEVKDNQFKITYEGIHRGRDLFARMPSINNFTHEINQIKWRYT